MEDVDKVVSDNTCCDKCVRRETCVGAGWFCKMCKDDMTSCKVCHINQEKDKEA